MVSAESLDGAEAYDDGPQGPCLQARCLPLQVVTAKTDRPGLLATKWLIHLIALAVAFALPNLAVSIVVLVVGGLVANDAAHWVRGDVSAISPPAHRDFAGHIVRAAMWVFVFIIAEHQIGIVWPL